MSIDETKKKQMEIKLLQLQQEQNLRLENLGNFKNKSENNSSDDNMTGCESEKSDPKNKFASLMNAYGHVEEGKSSKLKQNTIMNPVGFGEALPVIPIV